MSVLLEASQISKVYGDRRILNFDNFKIYSGDRIGVVGLNGSGKTTLLDVLSGRVQPDGGIVSRHCRITYIPQFENEKTAAGTAENGEAGADRPEDTPFLSGGERMRMQLSKAFAAPGRLVFADEPTANLDAEGVAQLRAHLKRVESFLLISHDRSLLDALCNKIIEIKDGAPVLYNGGYSFYKAQSALMREKERLEYDRYTAQKKHLEDAVDTLKQKAGAIRKAPKRMGNSEARLHRRAAGEKQEKINNAGNAIKTRLEKLEKKEKPRDTDQVYFDFSLTDPPANKTVIRAEGFSCVRGGRVLLENAGFALPNASKTALCGENGCGKTTLLNLIKDGHANIHIVPKAKIGYFYQAFENLDLSKTVLENALYESVQNENTVRTILARLLFKREDVFKRTEVLSGGERIRLSFAKLFVSDYNVLLLDEPTNYLDAPSVEVLEGLLRDYEGTVLFVSHDRAFVNAVADRLILFKYKKLITFDGNLDGYDESLKRAASDPLQETLLRMRLAEIMSKLSAQKDCAQLDAQYEEILGQLRQLEQVERLNACSTRRICRNGEKRGVLRLIAEGAILNIKKKSLSFNRLRAIKGGMRMKRAGMIILSVILFAALLIPLSSASADTPYFAVVDEKVLELTAENMPIRYNGAMYLPYTLFKEPLLKVYYSYNPSDYSLTFFNASKVLTFNLNTGVAFDHEKKYTQRALLTGGSIYVPVAFMCEQFGWRWTYLDMGPAVRIITPASKVSNDLFAHIAEDHMMQMLSEYNNNAQQSGQPQQSGSGSASASPSARTHREVYITFDGGPDKATAEILDALDQYGYKAAFFLDKDAIAAQGDILRRMWGSGHTLGLLYRAPEGAAETAGDMIRVLGETNDELDRVLLTRTRLVRLYAGSGAWSGSGTAFDELVAAGYRYWDWNVSVSEGQSVSAARIASRVISRLEKSKDCVLRLNANELTAQALPRILKYLDGEDCVIRSITESTMPVNDRSDVR